MPGCPGMIRIGEALRRQRDLKGLVGTRSGKICCDIALPGKHDVALVSGISLACLCVDEGFKSRCAACRGVLSSGGCRGILCKQTTEKPNALVVEVWVMYSSFAESVTIEEAIIHVSDIIVLLVRIDGD